jgi:hypothetical protein
MVEAVRGQLLDLFTLHIEHENLIHGIGRRQRHPIQKGENGDGENGDANLFRGFGEREIGLRHHFHACAASLRNLA